MILLFFAFPAAAGALIPFLPGLLRRNLGVFSAGVAALLFALAVSQIPEVSNGRYPSFTFPWVPALGAHLSLLLDGYALFFTLLITGVGFLIFAYSQRYMSEHPRRVKFYSWMLVFAGAMLGLVTSSNLILLYFFWEMTTISSFFLIGLFDSQEEARWNAVKALAVTILGGLAMLAGFILIYVTLGTFELTEIWSRGAELRDSPLLIPIVILVILGALTKSAIFPFHSWLPSAMVAPTPVSAYLHSATMVKGGVFLVARLTPLFASVPLWEWTLITLGLATLLIGGFLALRESDLKGLLAYSTISQLGMMVALYGLGTELAVKAATLHLMSHAIFKAGLFLVAGTIEYLVGTRDLRPLGGLAWVIPGLAAVAAVVSLSLAGIPPLSGFVSKEALIEASVASAGLSGWLMTAILVIGSAVTLAYSMKFLLGAFWGGRGDAVGPRRWAPLPLLIPPSVLALAALVIGVYPALVGAIISPAVESITQKPVHVSLYFWPGLTLPLALSALAILLGIGVYWRMEIINRLLAPLTTHLTLDLGYRYIVGLSCRTVPRIYLRLQNGDLRVYLVVIMAVVMALVAAGLLVSAPPPLADLAEGVNLGVLDYALAGLVTLGAVALLFRRRPLDLVLVLGFVGSLVAAAFALYSAPDLAITSIVVELLAMVLLMLALSRMLKLFNVSASRPAITLQALFSVAFGGLVTLLLLSVLATPQSPSISPFFIENSPAMAKAKNVVNTILVDFRGFDTLGEIAVVAIAALAIFVMVRAAKERV